MTIGEKSVPIFHDKVTHRIHLAMGSIGHPCSTVQVNVPSKLRACARTTFRPARTAFTYWSMLSIGHECYCSRGRPMRARRNKIRGNIGGKGPSIKYVTLFLTNFDPPPPCHTFSHIADPS